jgi:hypothetical protein
MRDADLRRELALEGGDFRALSELPGTKDCGHGCNFFFADVRSYEWYGD